MPFVINLQENARKCKVLTKEYYRRIVHKTIWFPFLKKSLAKSPTVLLLLEDIDFQALGQANIGNGSGSAIFRRWNKYHSVRFTEIKYFVFMRVLNQVTREVVWIELKEKDLVTEIITFEDVFVFSISRKNMSKFQQGKGLKMVSFFPELALRQCQCHFYTSISTQKKLFRRF